MSVPQSISDLHPEDVAQATAATQHLDPARPGSPRELYRVIVFELLEMIRTCGMDERHARLEFCAAYRWGKRSTVHYSYRVWRDEIALQSGRSRGRMSTGRVTEWLRQRWAEQAGQVRMFGDAT